MTREEMSQIFALMLLAWPNAPMLRPDSLEATINLWTFCLPEVDFLTGQMAMIQLCRKCHYPPSIAQMCETAERIQKELEGEIHHALLAMRNPCYTGHGNPNRAARAVALMGGEERLFIPVDEHTARLDIEGFRDAYHQVCQEETRQTIQALYPHDDNPKRLK